MMVHFTNVRSVPMPQTGPGRRFRFMSSPRTRTRCVDEMPVLPHNIISHIFCSLLTMISPTRRRRRRYVLLMGAGDTRYLWYAI